MVQPKDAACLEAAQCGAYLSTICGQDHPATRHPSHIFLGMSTLLERQLPVLSEKLDTHRALR